MTVDFAYSYCIKSTEQEKLDIDKQVRNNRFELKFAIFFPFLPFPFPMVPQVPFLPVEGFTPQQIVRNARDRAQSSVTKKLAPLAEAVDDCREAYEEYKEVKEIIESAEKLGKTWEKLNSEEKYESIRDSKTDVDHIAKNTGYKSKNIQNCKNHLFYDIHRLDRYESLGEPVEIKRFDANENQAIAWLKHEKAEQWHEQKHDAGYSESHEKAERHWSGTPWTNTEDKK